MKIKALLLAGAAGLLAAAPGVASASGGSTSSSSGTAQNYVVLYKGTKSPADAAATIAAAGGTVVADYKQIGVTIARSSSDSFRATLAASSGVEGVVDSGRLRHPARLGHRSRGVAHRTGHPGAR